MVRVSEPQADLLYHEARILLLAAAMKNSTIDGLTKIAKLDFLVRYPHYLPAVASDGVAPPSPDPIEAPMIRYKYGPWDDKYYPVIGALVGRGLMRFVKLDNVKVAVQLTPRGRRAAAALGAEPTWSTLASQCRTVAQNVGELTGAELQERVYRALPGLSSMPHGETIR